MFAQDPERSVESVSDGYGGGVFVCQPVRGTGGENVGHQKDADPRDPRWSVGGVGLRWSFVLLVVVAHDNRLRSFDAPNLIDIPLNGVLKGRAFVSQVNDGSVHHLNYPFASGHFLEERGRVRASR